MSAERNGSRGQDLMSNSPGGTVGSLGSSAGMSPSLTPSSNRGRVSGSENEWIEQDGLTPPFRLGGDSTDEPMSGQDEPPALHGQGPVSLHQAGIAAPQARRYAAGGDDRGSISSDPEEAGGDDRGSTSSDPEEAGGDNRESTSSDPEAAGGDDRGSTSSDPEEAGGDDHGSHTESEPSARQEGQEQDGEEDEAEARSQWSEVSSRSRISSDSDFFGAGGVAAVCNGIDTFADSQAIPGPVTGRQSVLGQSRPRDSGADSSSGAGRVEEIEDEDGPSPAKRRRVGSGAGPRRWHVDSEPVPMQVIPQRRDISIGDCVVLGSTLPLDLTDGAEHVTSAPNPPGDACATSDADEDEDEEDDDGMRKLKDKKRRLACVRMLEKNQKDRLALVQSLPVHQSEAMTAQLCVGLGRFEAGVSSNSSS